MLSDSPGYRYIIALRPMGTHWEGQGQLPNPRQLRKSSRGANIIYSILNLLNHELSAAKLDSYNILNADEMFIMFGITCLILL